MQLWQDNFKHKRIKSSYRSQRAQNSQFKQPSQIRNSRLNKSNSILEWHMPFQWTVSFVWRLVDEKILHRRLWRLLSERTSSQISGRCFIQSNRQTRHLLSGSRKKFCFQVERLQAGQRRRTLGKIPSHGHWQSH